MTEIVFHVGVENPVQHACRLVRDALAGDNRTIVSGPKTLLEAVDVALWAMAPHDFLAHCDANADARMLAVSPVILAMRQQCASLPHHQLLINLGEEMPEGFGSFEKLIEVICDSETSIVSGRQRWKYYKTRGYDLKKEDFPFVSA